MKSNRKRTRSQSLDHLINRSRWSASKRERSREPTRASIQMTNNVNWISLIGRQLHARIFIKIMKQSPDWFRDEQRQENSQESGSVHYPEKHSPRSQPTRDQPQQDLAHGEHATRDGAAENPVPYSRHLHPCKCG